MYFWTKVGPQKPVKYNQAAPVYHARVVGACGGASAS